mmetsp:Transcript_7110/g.15333  ORF Transcript_7110/g.15333 Transcript_7110/m.15333 type:complete len:448 (+) Transcript_7110:599-1942(+)
MCDVVSLREAELQVTLPRHIFDVQQGHAVSVHLHIRRDGLPSVQMDVVDDRLASRIFLALVCLCQILEILERIIEVREPALRHVDLGKRRVVDEVDLRRSANCAPALIVPVVVEDTHKHVPLVRLGHRANEAALGCSGQAGVAAAAQATLGVRTIYAGQAAAARRLATLGKFPRARDVSSAMRQDVETLCARTGPAGGITVAMCHSGITFDAIHAAGLAVPELIALADILLQLGLPKGRTGAVLGRPRWNENPLRSRDALSLGQALLQVPRPRSICGLHHRHHRRPCRTRQHLVLQLCFVPVIHPVVEVAEVELALRRKTISANQHHKRFHRRHSHLEDATRKFPRHPDPKVLISTCLHAELVVTLGRHHEVLLSKIASRPNVVPFTMTSAIFLAMPLPRAEGQFLQRPRRAAEHAADRADLRTSQGLPEKQVEGHDVGAADAEHRI